METWGTTNTTSNSYSFKLKRDKHCTPSMIHVDLECDALDGTYGFSGSKLLDRLTFDLPCRLVLIDEDKSRDPHYESKWTKLLPKSPNWGDVYTGCAWEMLTDPSRKLLATVGALHPNTCRGTPVLHRVDWDFSIRRWQYGVCFQQDTKNHGRLTIPLRIGDTILGEIGCVDFLVMVKKPCSTTISSYAYKLGNCYFLHRFG